MLKITKPFRYAKFTKISKEGLSDKQYLGVILDSFKKVTKLPKNVLRFKFLKIEIGECGSDFIRNVKTMKAEFEIIKFKR